MHMYMLDISALVTDMITDAVSAQFGGQINGSGILYRRDELAAAYADRVNGRR